MKQVTRLLLTALVAGLMLGASSVLAAEKPADKSADKPAAAKKEEKPKYRPFNGRIKTVEAAAIILEGPKAQTFQVTAATKIQKDGKPAKLAELKAGEVVGGRAREMSDGKWEALTLNVGTRAVKKPAETPKKEQAK